MFRRIISACMALVLLLTILPYGVFAAEENDEAIKYTDFLLSEGYQQLLGTRDKNAIEVKSCLIDLDEDQVDELLLSLTNTDNRGPRGYEQISALLDIQNSEVLVRTEAYYGGGSMGGDDLVIRYDASAKQYRLCRDGYIRDGVSAGFGYLYIYSSDDFTESTKIERTFYDVNGSFYQAEIQKVKNETSFWYEEDYDFEFYQIDGKYVSRTEHDEALSRYVEIDYEDLGLYHGTYDSPVKGYTGAVYDKADALQVFIENCDRRYFSEADISGFSEEDCVIARNAIYAKSGWIFSNSKLKNYFQKYGWYTPSISADSFTEDILNTYQITNRDLVVKYENKLAGNGLDALQTFIQHCDSRYFTASEIAGFTKEDCLYARNAIFAKSGWIFSNQKLANYFQQYSWYNPIVSAGEFTDDMLNEFQIANRDLIVAYENDIEAMQQTPSSATLATVWTTNEWNMSSKQAKEYSKAISNAVNKLDSLDVYGGRKEVYATLVNVDEEILLWLAGVVIRSEQPEWPEDIAFGQGSMVIMFEEIWEWNGTDAVKFNVLSEYGANANLWNEGLEVFTYYKGTDVDGEAWSALYPIHGGRLDTNPAWCHAWGWIYDYKLEGLDITGKSREEIASTFFSKLSEQGYWPSLPFDWTSVSITHEFSTHEFCAEVTGGSGYEEFYKTSYEDWVNKHGGNWSHSTSDALQCASYITKQDGTWVEAERAINYLNSLDSLLNEDSKNGLVVYSDYSTRELSVGSIITLGAVVLSDGNPVGNASEITFQIADPSILRVISTDDRDQYRYVKFEGLEAGTTNVAFNDSATGSTVVVPVTVFENRFHSYTLSNIPTQRIDKYLTNFYNVNGLYVDSYEYTVNADQSATVSFDVYNTNYSYGTVEVFDENGNLKDAVLIDKMTSSNTGFKEAVLDNLGYLVRDIFQGDLLSYRQESGFSKMTSVCVKVPKNGYITICMDPEESSVVGLVNYADLLLSMLDLTGEITGFSAKSKEFSGKLTAKIVNEKIFAEIVSDSDKMTQTLWKNIGKETLVTSESMGNFVDTAIRNLSEFGLLDVIRSTASDCGWSIGEKVFTDLAGPFGMALKIMFSVGKVENIVIQHHDVTHLAGCGCIVIQNQGGGIRSCQQIKVENEDGFDDDTALNVFSVTLEADVLDLVEKYRPEIYDKIIGGVTYTYNISLMKDGNETQPDGEVTVYIPIPDELKVLAYAGELTDGGLPVNIKIYRIEEDGTLTEMDARVEDGCFVFTTDHFSLYTIVGFDAPEEVQDPELENNNFAVITIAAAIAVAVLLIAVWAKKKKR